MSTNADAPIGTDSGAPAARSPRPPAAPGEAAPGEAPARNRDRALFHHGGLAALTTCVVARELRDGQVVAFGLHAELMLAAAMLAQQLHAPSLRIRHGLRAERGMIDGAAAWTARPVSRQLTDDGSGDNSWRRIEYRESHDAILRVANSRSPMRFCDVFFVGGMQIDAEGSTNLIGLKGADGRMRLRGPGSIGTTSIGTLAPEVILFSVEHSTRRFVERVDYVSVPGWRRRAAAGLTGGPRLVVTSKATMDFEDGRMRLRSVHPGYSVDEVVAATGFALRLPARVPVTQPPCAAERRALELLGLWPDAAALDADNHHTETHNTATPDAEARDADAPDGEAAGPASEPVRKPPRSAAREGKAQ